jgi:gamma-glutamyltranspeptidase
VLQFARSGFGCGLVHRRKAAGRRGNIPQSQSRENLRLLQQHGRDVFYKGEIAQAIVAKSNALGGTMTLEDLANYKGEWVEPAASDYRGYSLYELPPPSQS